MLYGLHGKSDIMASLDAAHSTEEKYPEDCQQPLYPKCHRVTQESETQPTGGVIFKATRDSPISSKWMCVMRLPVQASLQKTVIGKVFWLQLRWDKEHATSRDSDIGLKSAYGALLNVNLILDMLPTIQRLNTSGTNHHWVHEMLH